MLEKFFDTFVLGWKKNAVKSATFFKIKKGFIKFQNSTILRKINLKNFKLMLENFLSIFFSFLFFSWKHGLKILF